MTAGGEAAGVRGSAELTAFAEATVAGDPGAIASARAAVRTALGDEATVDAAAVIGNFQRMVRIADGCGIPLHHQSRLFDPFFTTKPVGQGTGLGLSVSYEIVRAHDGDIRVMSEPGEGATFEVCLPAVGESS